MVLARFNLFVIGLLKGVDKVLAIKTAENNMKMSFNEDK